MTLSRRNVPLRKKRQNKCLDKPFIFTYDWELLQLVPKNEESIKHMIASKIRI